MLTVGVTAVGGGIAQAVLDSLRRSSLRLRVVGFELSPWAKGAYECDEVHLLPAAGAAAYPEALKQLCSELGIALLIPGSDPELPVLSEAAASRRACTSATTSLPCTTS